MSIRIIGTGRAVPDRILTNADFERMVDTSDEWITTRTGIKERRVAEDDQALSDFAIPAADAALEMAGVQGSEVDLVICATVTSDMDFPATSTLVQDAIGEGSHTDHPFLWVVDREEAVLVEPAHTGQ